jgi:DDE family transposase
VAHPTPTGRTRQVAALQRRFAQAPGLPFADILHPQQVEQALRDEKVTFRNRLFAPLVTLWVFLSQVLDPDPSCRQAVARFLAWRAAHGQPSCSADTGAYCKARQRLPEGLLAHLTRVTGRGLQEQAPAGWRWLGRTVKVVDGSTVSMPDTPANQKTFPQMRSQKPGVGFPIARLVVLFSLTVGTVLDAAFGRYQGKQTGELSLFHTLHDALSSGDVLLGDRHYCSYWEIARAQECGADVVTRLHQCRRADFRGGWRLGRGDHLVVWPKPSRPKWMDEDTYARMPEALVMRELDVQVRQPGFRTRRLVVVTTLLDAAQASRQEVAWLYRLRWCAELDLRSLKDVLQMGVLRCQTPEMVRKEVWAHLLAYNLIRIVMAQAAQEAGLLPMEVSFKGALQTLNAFAALLLSAPAAALEELCRRLREAVARHRVGNRPDRYEPRAVKRRGKSYTLLIEPRQKARARWRSGRYD